MSTLDVTLSIEIAQRISTNSPNCFDNAYQAALVTVDSMYVQGFLVAAVEPYVPIEYAWIEIEERIIDPTLLYLHKNQQELYYFPAQSLSVQQLTQAIEEAQEDYPEDDPLPIYGMPPYDYYGEVMLGGTEYSAAYSAAIAKCQELNSK